MWKKSLELGVLERVGLFFFFFFFFFFSPYVDPSLCSAAVILNKHIRAATRQNQQSGMCAQRRLRSAWASAESDQSLRCPHRETFGP